MWVCLGSKTRTTRAAERIDYEKFHDLVAEGKEFTALDYALPTPEWAVLPRLKLGKRALGSTSPSFRVLRGLGVGTRSHTRPLRSTARTRPASTPSRSACTTTGRNARPHTASRAPKHTTNRITVLPLIIMMLVVIIVA